MKPGSDKEIWEKLKSGNADAFYWIYDKHVDLLINAGLHYSNDKEFVKDCIHDLFLDLHKYRKKLSETDNIKLYLIKSLKRKIVREQARKQSIGNMDQLPKAEIFMERSPEDQMIGKETDDKIQMFLRKALAKLSERQREGLFLRFSDGLSYPEIAKIMDVSVESARTIIYRGIKALREQIGSEYLSILLFLPMLKRKSFIF